MITHAHEDHIGALPYLAQDLGVPLYANAFTATLIRGKLEREGLADDIDVRVIPEGGSIDLAPFKCTMVRLAHSIPDMDAVVGILSTRIRKRSAGGGGEGAGKGMEKERGRPSAKVIDMFQVCMSGDIHLRSSPAHETQTSW